jgi:hypothetical protein
MAMISKYDILTFSITRACKLAYYSRFMTLCDQMPAGGIKGRFLLKSVVEKCYLWHCTTYIMDLRWDSIVRSYVFICPFGFSGSDVKLCWLLPSWDTILVPWWSQLAENIMEAEIWGPVMVVPVFMARWNWLGDSWHGAAASKVEATTYEKSKVIPCKVKIQCLALIGCAWQ